MSDLSEDDQDLIIECLAEGFGAEDISVIHKIPLQSVRAYITSLREEQALTLIYENGGGAA